MKFSSLFIFATMALAAPTSDVRAPSVDIETRQTTVTGAIADAVNSLKAATNTNVASIRSAVATIEGSVSAEVQATVRANLKAIAEALRTATAQILGATVGATGGIIAAASNLSQAQINQLIEALKTTLDSINQIRAVVDIQATDLTPAVAVLVQSEINVVRQAISPFIAPLIVFARAVQAFSARAGVTVIGLKGVTDTLFTNVRNLLASLGLPFSLPNIPGIN